MQRLVLTLVAANLTSIGLLVPAVWAATLGGTALFIASMWDHACSARTAVARSIMYAGIVSAASVFWFWDAWPLGWLHMEHPATASILLLLTWLAAAVAMSVGPSVLGIVLWASRRSEFRILIAGCVFVLVEETRMWGFALLTYAPSVPLGPHFSIGSLGYALSESPFLLQLSSIGGVQALTFFAAILAGCIAVISAKKGSRLERVIVVTCLVVISVLPVFYSIRTQTSVSHEPLSVVLVSTRNPIGTSLPNEIATGDLLAGALHEAPDLVIFPEGYAVTEALTRMMLSGAVAKESLVVSTSHTPVNGGGYSVDMVYDSTTHGRVVSQSKKFLMALGEYNPVVAQSLYAPLSSQRIATYLDSISVVRAGAADPVVVPFKSHVLGGLLCSESISPYLYQRLAHAGANILINSANPSWFPDSKILYAKSLQVARVQAVSNNAYYLQASNMLPSFVVSPRGELLRESPWGQTAYVSVTIQ